MYPKVIKNLFLALMIVTISSYAEELFELYNPSYKEPTELSKKSPLRKELFNLIRIDIAKEAKEPVQFSGSLKVYHNWAFFVGRSLDMRGQSIPFLPMGNDDTIALWLRTIKGWVLVDYSVGHSDVFWYIWHDKYGVSKKLLNL